MPALLQLLVLALIAGVDLQLLVQVCAIAAGVVPDNDPTYNTAVNNTLATATPPWAKEGHHQQPDWSWLYYAYVLHHTKANANATGSVVTTGTCRAKGMPAATGHSSKAISTLAAARNPPNHRTLSVRYPRPPRQPARLLKCSWLDAVMTWLEVLLRMERHRRRCL